MNDDIYEIMNQLEQYNGELLERLHTDKKKIERLEKQLDIAKHALIEYAYGQIQEVQEIDGEDVPLTYPYSNDEGEVAKNALKQIRELKK